MTEWSDDPAFWEAMEAALCAAARLARAEGDVQAIEACVGLRPGARVLGLAGLVVPGVRLDRGERR